MKRELGDICWYIAQACMALDTSFDEIIEMNVDKLKKRYPVESLMFISQRIEQRVISKYLKLFSDMFKVFKEKQEQCSIITTYYAIEKINLTFRFRLELKNTLTRYILICQMI